MSAGVSSAIATGTPAGLSAEPTSPDAPTAGVIPLAGAAAGQATTTATLTVPATAAIVVPPEDVTQSLIAWAHQHEQRFGVRLARVDVSLIDERGHPLTVRFPVPASDPPGALALPLTPSDLAQLRHERATPRSPRTANQSR